MWPGARAGPSQRGGREQAIGLRRLRQGADSTAGAAGSHGRKGTEPRSDDLIYVLKRFPGCSIRSGEARAESGDEAGAVAQ